MEVTIKVLEAMFQGMSPSRLWQLIKTPRRLSNTSASWEMLTQYCSGYLMGYSLNEQEIILQQICNKAAQKAGKHAPDMEHQPPFLPQVALYTVLDLAQKFLVIQGRDHLCRVEQLMAWRDISLSLGQDLFTCAFLAWEDIQNNRERKSFAWPAVLRADHRGLQGMLDKKLAENHQHLYGSSQTFPLSWCSLMNYADAHDIVEQKFQELFSPFHAVSGQDKMLSTKERIQYACLCRIFLFRWARLPLNHVSHEERDRQIGELYNGLLSRLQEDQIAHTLPTLRALYGAAVPQPTGKTDCLDYALEPHVFWAEPDAPYRSLAGERSLLYNCMKRFFQNEMDQRIQMVFYVYLILKNMFRGEMVQTNRKVGFENFSKYQDRKDDLCQRPCYGAELIRMAVNAPLSQGNVSSLETRLTPKSTAYDDIKKVLDTDHLRDFADRLCGTPAPPKRMDELGAEEKQYFFVFHFIKKKDTGHPKDQIQAASCRHWQLRREVRIQANALALALSRSPWMYKRVRGIDAASNEVVCPPEVFAQGFRFLRHFRPEDFSTAHSGYPRPYPRLSATYHVGEDFFDIAGSLRAIDETIEFLELSRGDRLGHALGLGIDPRLHYKLKGKKIFQTKQERLDNLVWLTHRARDFGVDIDPQLYGKLKKEAEILLLEIYGNLLREISLTEYYCAMHLRGDDPQRYISGEYVRQQGILHPYDRAGILKRDYLEQYRSHNSTANLYHLYHFNAAVKRIGAEPIKVTIESPYIQLMQNIQDAMQWYIKRKGIIIECNPSSNVLIGTFQSYENHPIFRFHNAALEQDAEIRGKCSQLQVCVNTDDLGVFDTSQELEYALLFQALNGMHKEDGSKTYHDTDIIAYLESLREMGHEATFPDHDTV